MIGLGVSITKAAVLGQRSLLSSATSQLGGIAPYHYWDFINDRALFASADVGDVDNTPGWSFTRASTGYAETVAGTLTSFASGALRRTDKGVLIEGARTNIAPYSQQIENAGWSSSTSVTMTADAGAAPDGTTTADRLQGTAADWFRGQPIVLASGTVYTISLYVRSNNGSAQNIRLFGDAGQLSGNLAVTTSWTRVSYTFTSATTGSRNNGIARDTSNNLADILVWGFQMEAASFPSSYIPTTTASATRAAEPGSVGSLTGLDTAVGMFAEVGFQTTTSAVQTLLQLDDGTANNRLIVRRNASGNAEMELITGGASQGTVTGGAMANNVTHKLAVSAGSNSLKLTLNGTSAAEDTTATMPTGLANLRFAGGISSALPGFNYTRRAAIFNAGNSFAQQVAMTT